MIYMWVQINTPQVKALLSQIYSAIQAQLCFGVEILNQKKTTEPAVPWANVLHTGSLLKLAESHCNATFWVALY